MANNNTERIEGLADQIAQGGLLDIQRAESDAQIHEMQADMWRDAGGSKNVADQMKTDASDLRAAIPLAQEIVNKMNS